MSDRLTINDDYTYRVVDDNTEEWSGVTINGQLDLSDGNMHLVDNPTTPGEEPFDVDEDGFLLPLGISLPMRIKGLRMVTTGFGLVLLGTLGTLGGLSAALENYFAGVVLMLAVLALVLAGTVGIGLEWFWALIVLTALLLAMGLVLRGVSDA